MQELQAQTGVVPLFYTDANRTQTLWTEEFASYPLWVADYNGESAPEDNPIWSGWTAWQFSDTGSVSGVADDVDLDLFTNGVFFTDDERSSNTQSRRAGGVDTVYYTVKPGDSFFRIAGLYGISPYALAAANGLSIRAIIYPGEVLIIPLSGTTPAPGGSYLYTVQRGDTLWALSRRCGTTVDALARQNGIANPNLILVGQQLRLPCALQNSSS